MPGFIVNEIGEGAKADSIRPYYSFTWQISNLFEDRTPIDNQSPLIYVREATLPSWDFDKEKVMGASLEYKFAKSIVWNDIKIIWYDTDGLAEIMQIWRSTIWAPHIGLALANDYKKESTLQSFDFSFENPVSWKLINSWPGNVKVGDLTYVNSDVKMVEVTLVYDWAEETIAAARIS